MIQNHITSFFSFIFFFFWKLKDDHLKMEEELKDSTVKLIVVLGNCRIIL